MEGRFFGSEIVECGGEYAGGLDAMVVAAESLASGVR